MLYYINYYKDKKLYLRILTGKKAPSNKTPALIKSRNTGIWVVATSHQLFITAFSTETKFPKN